MLTEQKQPPSGASRCPPTGLLAVGVVVQHFATWYRRTWRGTIASSLLVPAFFLVAFGVLFARLVPAGTLPGGSYLHFLTPGLLVVVLVYTVMTEASYPVVSGFVWSRAYVVMHSSPLTPRQIVAGQICWLALRLLLVGGAFVLVALVLGGVFGPGILLSLGLSVFVGTGFAAVIVAFSAPLPRAEPAIPTLVRLLLVPGSLFTGTYYPVDGLPTWLRVVAWSLPQWHATELSRAAAVGTLHLGALVVHLAYGAGLLSVGWWLSCRRFTRRLTK